MIESNYLKDDVRNINQLLRIPALKEWPIRDLGMLLRISKIRQYDDKECVIREGDTDNLVFFLLSGKIKLVQDRIALGVIDQEGAIFGEMRLIDGLSRSTSAFAFGKSICLAVDTDAKDRLSSPAEVNELVNRLLRLVSETLSFRLRLANNNIVQVKKAFNKLKIASIALG